ncbi:IclR family transcriptional regulator [Rhizobium sp. CSW-27]|nr:IclR family transcriptional regulator [Rhizobium sp. CSW-27]
MRPCREHGVNQKQVTGAQSDASETDKDAGRDVDKDAGTGTLGKAIALLDLIARADVPPRFTDLLALSGQPRGSLHRQLRHLAMEGLVELGPDGGYTPGLRLLQFASRAWSRHSFRQVAEPHLKHLHDLTGETVHLGLLREGEIVYLDKIESRQAVRMHSQVGNAAPVYCTGVGKAALACLPGERLAALASHLVFQPFTPATLRDADALLSEIEAIRARGHAFDLEEHQPGIRCVAAAILVPEANILGGISVTAPAFRADMDQLQAWSVNVCAAARAIVQDASQRLGPRR